VVHTPKTRRESNTYVFDLHKPLMAAIHR
jgi:hypothetical protein